MESTPKTPPPNIKPPEYIHNNQSSNLDHTLTENNSIKLLGQIINLNNFDNKFQDLIGNFESSGISYIVDDLLGIFLKSTGLDELPYKEYSLVIEGIFSSKLTTPNPENNLYHYFMELKKKSIGKENKTFKINVDLNSY